MPASYTRGVKHRAVRYSANNAWNVNLNTGNVNNNNTNNRYFVVGASESVPDVDGWAAAERSFYKNKHRSIGAQRIHVHPGRVTRLARLVESGEYTPRPGYRFALFEPSPREIFAAFCEDRLVHHYVAPYITEVAERIHNKNGDVSHGNRIGHSAHTGAAQIRDAIAALRETHAEPYVAKVDIRSCFPSVPRAGAAAAFERYAKECCMYDERMLAICRKLFLHDPVPGCMTLSSAGEISRVPERKLLKEGPDGFPIGNFYSQLIVNLYLAEIDAALKPYGVNPRFVDDKCIVAPDKATALEEIALARSVAASLRLTMHPEKIYIQPAHRGVNFCGRTIKGGRLYLTKRTVRRAFRRVGEEERTEEGARRLWSSVNSYLGIMRHCTEHKNEVRLAEAVLVDFGEWLYFIRRDGHPVCRLRKRYNLRTRREQDIKTMINIWQTTRTSWPR